MRNRRLTIVIAMLTLLPVCLLLLGCPKKTPEIEPVPTTVTTKTQPAAKPTPTGPGGDIPPRGREASTETRIAAARGEDIPLQEPSTKQFQEPTPTEKQVLKTIYFDYDKSDIRPEYRSVLDGIGGWLKTNSGRQLLIEGHCDERGTNEYNLALGERRALSVRRYLVALGIAPERLHTISYGEEKPVDPGHDEAAWAKNRRAEFKVSTDQ